MPNDFPRRGDIYLFRKEIKNSLGLILSNDIANENSKILMIAPMTGNFVTVYPFEVVIEINGCKNKAMFNQIRPIHRNFLKEKLCRIDDTIMQKAEVALKVSLGIT